MLGNGMMGAGMITNSVVFFGLFVWISFLILFIATCFWMMRTVRGLKERYNSLREPISYDSGVLTIGVAGGRIRGEESRKKDRAA